MACCRVRRGSKIVATALIDEANTLSWEVRVTQDVFFRLLTNCNDKIRFATSALEFTGVELCINPVVILGMGKKDKIVDGNHSPNSSFTYTVREFARKSMKKLYAVALQIFHDAFGSPQIFLQT